MIAAAKASGYADTIYNSSDFTNGYVNGLLIIQAITKAGNNLTRASLNAVMPTIQNFSTGGLSPDISYSPTNSVGINCGGAVQVQLHDERLGDPGHVRPVRRSATPYEYQNGNIDKFNVNCISS